MASGPKKTAPVARHLRRNPNAPHVKMWAAYRERKEKPKAVLEKSRGEPLTFERYEALVRDYRTRAKDSERHQKQAATVSRPIAGYEIAKQIVKDFGRTKGLRVFGFGVGYGVPLFFLKNFMKAKVKGVDLGRFSKKLTKKKALKVLHGTNAADPSLKSLGKFDVTYSIDVFERDVMDKQTAFAMFRNVAAMTRKGGKSYHLIQTKGLAAFPKGDLQAMAEALGLKLEEWAEAGSAGFLINLTKV